MFICISYICCPFLDKFWSHDILTFLAKFRRMHVQIKLQNIRYFPQWTELNPIIGQISDNYNRDLLIAGDFNINLLHINYCNKEHFGNFMDLFLGYSLFPKITFSTRLGENSCSLIDNIFGSLSPNIITSPAGILFSRISDPFFIS